ncbi:pyridoxal-phosphate dependent enzyme [Desulfofundulus thermobenzoicus]|uniref:Pyridoxal-phosphate dependent enzyme n=1 Tax=Desulfofundulus thermobenzoicus TaxID=29376 RepID=A0A6N7IN04_9FIRM|nr:threonine synthase [Desulfofundulus thermobenzoicus]MQL51341.1 pyridoxal-phosphate dependent enzyme [Desulfofundulus thermobenzoicus]
MLICTSCGRSYPDDTFQWHCVCGGAFKYRGHTCFDPEAIKGRPAGLWRYREALPVRGEQPVSFSEGFTPLFKTSWDGAPVYFKLDYLLPTGSFKDRGISVLVSKLKEMGVTEIAEDSSGNAGASMAAYCALAGIRCHIYVPADTSTGKTVPIELCGAHLVRVPGSREDTALAVREAASRFYYASHNWNPFFLEGVKTLAFEIWEQLGCRVPDNVVVPAGYGSLVLGLYYGFTELKGQGLITGLPRIFAVQAEACAPLFKAHVEGWSVPPSDFKGRATAAEGIACSSPVRGAEVLNAVRISGGTFVTVGEKDIWAGLRSLAMSGLYVEPTAAVVARGMTRLRSQGFLAVDETTVAVLSGAGTKATAKIQEKWKQDRF